MRRLRWVGVGLLIVLVVMVALSGRSAWALVRYAGAPWRYTVPVAGVGVRALVSSWGEPRSEQRRHQGIDIFAARGTPVVAATDGEVVKVGQNRLGGNVVGVIGAGAAYYYYAHLDRFAPGIAVGQAVTAGTTLGFVGNTGNAVDTPPHLHFGVYPALRLFRAVDPAPLLIERGDALHGRGPR